MAQIQKYFEKFHENIRTDYDMNQTLREKRDIILNRIRNYLAKNSLPRFDELLQGSYKMKTGVIPILNLEYDIDVGLRFNFSENEYSAETVRKWVFRAVDAHTNRVEEKNPCIRVTYSDGYHVDIVIYACWEVSNGIKQYRLAHKTNGWRLADPERLIECVREARKPFQETKDSLTKTDQFRRIVRYLRRASDVRIPKEDKVKPTGLAFVLLCKEHLKPILDWKSESDDRKALELFATKIANIIGRIVAKKPTPEYEDMFERLSNKDMDDLKTWFGNMATKLNQAERIVDPIIACQSLQEVFGRDFPVPSIEDTTKKTSSSAIVTSSSSAVGEENFGEIRKHSRKCN